MDISTTSNAAAGAGSEAANGGTVVTKMMVDDSPIMRGGEAEKSADFANYFVSYAVRTSGLASMSSGVD